MENKKLQELIHKKLLIFLYNSDLEPPKCYEKVASI